MSVDYHLEIIERGDYVIAKLGGVRSPETLLAAASTTTSYCKEHGFTRVLIDLRDMAGGLDTLETFEVAGHRLPHQNGVRLLVRSAILDHTENVERIRFFETVALNRGLNVKVFDDRGSAVEWLRSDSTA
jgi:hypothetical protein